MQPWLSHHLAEAAAFERDVRARFYPGPVQSGAVPKEEADADLAAWTVITELLRTGTCQTDLTLADLELWTGRALISREQALEEKPEDEKLRRRRDAVWAIHERVSHRRAMVHDINYRLQARAERKAA